MRKARLFLGVIPGLVLTIGAQAASAENYRGTMEQQMACTPDVWRYCGDQIPDANRITACLQRHASNLSSGCRAVFESNNSMPSRQAAPPSARGRRSAPPTAQVAPPPGDVDGDE